MKRFTAIDGSSVSGVEPNATPATTTQSKVNLPYDSGFPNSITKPLIVKRENNSEPLEARDIHHLNAAQGWLELGDCQSALDELELIDPLMQSHPDVLAVRCDIYTETMKLSAVVDIAGMLVRLVPDEPSSWIRRSFALHGLKQTQQAFNLLLPAASKFPEDATIPYNLACYCAQLGMLEDARRWLHQSYEIGDSGMLKSASRFDPDLSPLFINASAI